MKIQLHELVKVSNNSRLTSDVLNILNEKLSAADLNTFKEWLRLIENKKK